MNDALQLEGTDTETLGSHIKATFEKERKAERKLLLKELRKDMQKNYLGGPKNQQAQPEKIGTDGKPGSLKNKKNLKAKKKAAAAAKAAAQATSATGSPKGILRTPRGKVHFQRSKRKNQEENPEGPSRKRGKKK